MPSPSGAFGLSRRSLLLAALAAVPASWALPPRTLQFPRDFGSHPDLQTEWWYITGHAKNAAGREFGFQVTFFRSRIDATQNMRSAFAAKNLVFAHAAVTDLEGRVLLHDQRIARAGFGVASASEADTEVRLRDWSLVRKDGSYAARIPAGEFALDLRFVPTQPVLLQGNAGLSRKGPDEAQASYYYSEPQLKTQGKLTLKGQAFEVDGTAWLDHEWSEALMHGLSFAPQGWQRSLGWRLVPHARRCSSRLQERRSALRKPQRLEQSAHAGEVPDAMARADVLWQLRGARPARRPGVGQPGFDRRRVLGGAQRSARSTGEARGSGLSGDDGIRCAAAAVVSIRVHAQAIGYWRKA